MGINKGKPALTWNVLYSRNDIVCDMCGKTHGGYIENIARATTLGLEEQFGHTEFELVLELPLNIVGHILNTLGRMVAGGRTFKDKELVSEVLTIDIRLDKVSSHGKEFLRVIIPDANGRWPEDAGCEYPYSAQTLPMSALEEPEPHHTKS